MTAATDSKNIALTTIAHLGGWNRLSAMTGAKNLIYLNRTESRAGGVTFKFGRKCAFVELAHDDTYTLRVGRIVKYEFRETSATAGLFFDGLKPAFESATGLYLTL